MGAIANVISLAIQIYIWVILAQVILSWLIIFGVVNVQNKKAKNLIDLLEQLTDPVYKPIKKYIPPIGGIDITPLIVILGLSLLDGIVISVLT